MSILFKFPNQKFIKHTYTPRHTHCNEGSKVVREKKSLQLEKRAMRKTLVTGNYLWPIVFEFRRFLNHIGRRKFRFHGRKLT